MPLLKQKYERKPLFVDAVQVTAENFKEVAQWCKGQISLSDGSKANLRHIDPSTQHIHVQVNNPIKPRQSKAFVGDWVLETRSGFKVYTNKSFRAVFRLSDVAEESPKSEITRQQEAQVKPIAEAVVAGVEVSPIDPAVTDGVTTEKSMNEVDVLGYEVHGRTYTPEEHLALATDALAETLTNTIPVTEQ